MIVICVDDPTQSTEFIIKECDSFIVLYTRELALKSLRIFSFFLFMAVAMASLGVSAAVAQEQKDLKLDILLEDLVKTHDRIQASQAQLKAVKHQHESAWGGWYPQVDLSMEGGKENIKKPGSVESQMVRNEMNLSASQLLYDFGGTGGAIDATAGQVKEYEALLSQTEQEIVALGIISYMRVIRARELVKYAIRSEESIKELSGMQELLVERGAGYSYEELQVKGQLAGAKAYRVTQERELQIALNNFKSVFGFILAKDDAKKLNAVPVPRKFLPANLEDAVATAFDNNPQLLETQHSLERLQGSLRSEESNYYPKLNALLEAERKENDQASSGVRTEQRATVQLSYNLFSGFSDSENISAVKSEMTGAKKTLLDRRRTIEESVSNAWLELTTLRQNSELYETRANITWEFLGLVKKKKATGEEVSLLDILVGERDYIQAISDKIATDMDIIIAGYTLLYEMGLITKDITDI